MVQVDWSYTILVRMESLSRPLKHLLFSFSGPLFGLLLGIGENDWMQDSYQDFGIPGPHLLELGKGIQKKLILIAGMTTHVAIYVISTKRISVVSFAPVDRPPLL